LQGLLLSWENIDPTTFHDIVPALLHTLRDDLDYEAYPVVELIEQAAALYADPKNADLALPQVLTLAMTNLNGGKRHDPEGTAFAQSLVKARDAPPSAQK